jgi:hypothetical protein
MRWLEEVRARMEQGLKVMKRTVGVARGVAESKPKWSMPATSPAPTRAAAITYTTLRSI